VICRDCPPGIYTMKPDGTNRQQLKMQNFPRTTAAPGSLWYSRDSKRAFLPTNDRDGTTSIWQLPTNGNREERLIHFADPAVQLFRATIGGDSSKFYVVIGDRQSDVWTMELKKK
jgi:hypothetical protein